MRGNVVVAAAVFAAGVVIAALVIVLGLRSVVNGATDRLDAAVKAHGRSVERGGEQAGAPIRSGLDDLAAAMNRHGKSVQDAGERIAHPQLPADYTIRLQGPVAVQQPLTVRGPAEDGALPINARIAK
jgi:hypothetical protein